MRLKVVEGRVVRRVAPGEENTTELTPLAKRIVFVRCLAGLVLWAQKQGLDLALDEGMIQTPRHIREEVGTRLCADGAYLPRSLHYLGLAQDFFLYREGEPITDHEHPSWYLLAERWESLHLLCTSGARRIATSSDSDRLCRAGIRHFSFGEGSKVYSLPWKR